MKKTINITIEATFGSEFQEEFALNSLDGVLKGWMQYLHSSHKKNKLTFEYVTFDLINKFEEEFREFLTSKLPKIN